MTLVCLGVANLSLLNTAYVSSHPEELWASVSRARSALRKPRAWHVVVKCMKQAWPPAADVLKKSLLALWSGRVLSEPLWLSLHCLEYNFHSVPQFPLCFCEVDLTVVAQSRG